MPEGDTIHTLVNAMRPRLDGQPVVELRLRERGAIPSLAGALIGPVEALGKHVLIGLGDEWILRTHLGMRGSWHRYATGETWRRPASTAGVVLATPRDVFVCFTPPQAELFGRASLASHPILSRLGPDLLAATFDRDEIVRRARAHQHAERAIADVLLDQTVACGIGNVYKSELLFIRRTNPWSRVAALPDATLVGIFDDARALMRRNLGSGPRVTTYLAPRGSKPRARYATTWVYHRVNEPCLVCVQRIQAGRQGDLARATYWCPQCQGNRRPEGRT